MGCWTPPFGNPQVLAGAPFLAELLAACAAGASVPLGKAASACALATIAAPPPLRVGGWRPLAPHVPQREKSADHARTRMVPRPKRLLRRSLRKSRGSSCRAAARSSVTPLARLWPQATLARPPAGNPKGGAALFGQSLPTFCWPESRGPARPERVEGKIRNLKEGKEDKRKSPARKTVSAAREVPRRGKRVEGISKNYKKRKKG